MENRRKKTSVLPRCDGRTVSNQLEYMDRALDNKTSYEYHIDGNVYYTIAENGVCV